jgi:hypothetical protein
VDVELNEYSELESRILEIIALSKEIDDAD